MIRIAKGGVPAPTPKCFSQALTGSRYTIREREAYQRVWGGERGVRAEHARIVIETLVRSGTLNPDEMIARLLCHGHLLDAGYAYSSQTRASFSDPLRATSATQQTCYPNLRRVMSLSTNTSSGRFACSHSYAGHGTAPTSVDLWG